MKRLLLAIALAGALSATALAGEIHTTGLQSPQPLADELRIASGRSSQDSESVAATLILTILNLIVT
jgi:hypothetical protein